MSARVARNPADAVAFARSSCRCTMDEPGQKNSSARWIQQRRELCAKLRLLGRSVVQARGGKEIGFMHMVSMIHVKNSTADEKKMCTLWCRGGEYLAISRASASSHAEKQKRAYLPASSVFFRGIWCV